jgi:hypothetical protein
MRGLFVSVEGIHRSHGVVCTNTKARLLVMKMPYTKSGKSGDTVWQRARYGQICYPAFIPFNPRTPAQVAVRGNFRAVSARWRTLTQEQRDVWIAVAWTKWSKPRLGTGRLTGCQFFVKTNVPLANHGKPQVDLPLEYSRSTKPPVMAVFRIHPSSFILQPLLAGVVVSKRDTRTGRTLLRYRACTVVPPYQHHSNTLAGRCAHHCSKNRVRFPCRSQPPHCRGAPVPHLGH